MGGGRIAIRSICTQPHFVHERPFPAPVKQRRDASDDEEKNTYNTQLADSVVARVNSDCADMEMSNANEFTQGTHDRNLNPATPAELIYAL
jgi:hypothetical protein